MTLPRIPYLIVAGFLALATLFCAWALFAQDAPNMIIAVVFFGALTRQAWVDGQPTTDDPEATP